MTDLQIPDTVKELETLLPVLLEKERAGKIKGGSHAKAVDLVGWAKRRPLSDPQLNFVGRLLNRAKRKSRGMADISLATQVVQKVDAKEVAKEVLAILGNEAGAVAKQVVDRAVEEALDKRAPRKIEVVVQTGVGKPVAAKGPTHRQFQHLARAAAMRLPGGFAPGIFLQGEASSGKTTGARQLAEAMKLPWHFNGAISFPHEMLGFIDGAGKYHRTPFREAYEKGGVYTFDEVDRSDPVALLAVNPHLANGVATFPDKQVQRHKDCIIVCTANTWGLGADANYSGATKLDAAFLSRFPVRINWDIDPELESEIVGAGEWLDRVRAARQRARAVGLKVLIDTRAAQAGAALIAAGYTVQEAAEMTYLANLKPEQRKQVEGML